jgi:hypothetical protein
MFILFLFILGLTVRYWWKQRHETKQEKDERDVKVSEEDREERESVWKRTSPHRKHHYQLTTYKPASSSSSSPSLELSPQEKRPSSPIFEDSDGGILPVLDILSFTSHLLNTH